MCESVGDLRMFGVFYRKGANKLLDRTAIPYVTNLESV
jgi:hypothetical protein